MPAEERFTAILSILQKRGVVAVLGLTQALSISESTVRRDLVTLHKMGRLKKVHGGAMLLYKKYGLCEAEVIARNRRYAEEKKRIAHYTVSLIQACDFVYIDAGSTTLHMVEYPKEEEVIYATNGLEHGRRLATQGFHTSPLIDELESKTEAVVSLGAASSPQKYNFNKVLFETSGITVDSDSTIPDTNEVYVKMETTKHTQKYCILADSGGFGTCTSITTADISDATIITGKGVEREYLEEVDIIEVEE